MSQHTKTTSACCRGCECVRNGKACTNCIKRTSLRTDRTEVLITHSAKEKHIVEGMKDNENVEPGEIENWDKLLQSKSQKDKI